MYDGPTYTHTQTVCDTQPLWTLLCVQGCAPTCVFTEAATVHTCANVSTLHPVRVELMHEKEVALQIKALNTLAL